MKVHLAVTVNLGSVLYVQAAALDGYCRIACYLRTALYVDSSVAVESNSGIAVALHRTCDVDDVVHAAFDIGAEVA